MESRLRLPAGHCGRQRPHQVTRRALWETESRGAARGTLGGPSEPRADPQVVSHPEAPAWVQTLPYRQLGEDSAAGSIEQLRKATQGPSRSLTAFAADAEMVGAMMDPTAAGYGTAGLACDARLRRPHAPTRPLCPQYRKRNCLLVKGGTGAACYWPPAAVAFFSCRALIGRGTSTLAI